MDFYYPFAFIFLSLIFHNNCNEIHTPEKEDKGIVGMPVDAFACNEQTKLRICRSYSYLW